jgi:hypothetical protein
VRKTPHIRRWRGQPGHGTRYAVIDDRELFDVCRDREEAEAALGDLDRAARRREARELAALVGVGSDPYQAVREAA